MFQYFVRRLLLAIPTFIGCTMVVFAIVQFAPGGAYEMQLNALKKGGAGGEGGAATAIGAEASNIPPSQLEALQRYYQVDRPVWQRYLIWMGIMTNKVDDYQAPIGKPRKVGNDQRVLVRTDPSTGALAVF